MIKLLGAIAFIILLIGILCALKVSSWDDKRYNDFDDKEYFK